LFPITNPLNRSLYLSSMNFGKLLAVLGFLTFHQPISFAQSTHWGQLMMNLPGGWSSNMKAGNFVYSNYNIKDSEPFSITLFKPEDFSGKPDSLFYTAWKKYLSQVFPAPEVPRPRRWTTDNELLLFTASKELADKTNPAFYVFGIYVLEGTYQAFLIETSQARTYKNVQVEWQERFLAVSLANPKKK